MYPGDRLRLLQRVTASHERGGRGRKGEGERNYLHGLVGTQRVHHVHPHSRGRHVGDDGQQVQTVLLANNSLTNYYMYRGLTVATRLFLPWEGLEPDNLAMTSES